MNVGRVYTAPICIASHVDPSTVDIGARDEHWKDVRAEKIDAEVYRPTRQWVRGRAINVGRVYTPPTFIARGIDHSTRGIGARDECWVYTAPKFIARGIDPSARDVGAQYKCWEGVYPSEIHREGYRPLDRGYWGT